MYEIDFAKPIHVHFIGIGGISMSGLAIILLKEGFTVSGSDNKESELTEELRKEGATVYIGQRADNISSDIDLVVYSAAIRKDNPEFGASLESNLPMLSRAELLGQMMRNYACPIAISGTHGKTTTSSMAGEILMVEVQPVVFWQFAFDDLLIIDDGVGDFGVGEHQGHGIVPRQFVFRGIDGNLRFFGEPYFVHIVLYHRDFVENLGGLQVGDDFVGDTAYQTFVFHCAVVGAHKAAATIVQQPTHVNLMSYGEVGDTVCFQMVALC